MRRVRRRAISQINLILLGCAVLSSTEYSFRFVLYINYSTHPGAVTV